MWPFIILHILFITSFSQDGELDIKVIEIGYSDALQKTLRQSICACEKRSGVTHTFLLGAVHDDVELPPVCQMSAIVLWFLSDVFPNDMVADFKELHFAAASCPLPVKNFQRAFFVFTPDAFVGDLYTTFNLVLHNLSLV